MKGKILFAEREGVHVLKFVGDVRVTLGPTINSFLERIGQCENFKSIIIDLSETEGIDSTALGLLAKIALRTKESFDAVPTIVSPNEDITRILMSMGFDKVFVILDHLSVDCGKPGELPTEIISEQNLRKQVLEAHKLLMSLNESNEQEFKDLVEALEDEGSNEIPAHRVAQANC